MLQEEPRLLLLRRLRLYMGKVQEEPRLRRLRLDRGKVQEEHRPSGSASPSPPMTTAPAMAKSI